MFVVSLSVARPRSRSLCPPSVLSLTCIYLSMWWDHYTYIYISLSLSGKTFLFLSKVRLTRAQGSHGALSCFSSLDRIAHMLRCVPAKVTSADDTQSDAPSLVDICYVTRIPLKVFQKQCALCNISGTSVSKSWAPQLPECPLGCAEDSSWNVLQPFPLENQGWKSVQYCKVLLQFGPCLTNILSEFRCGG